jgi:hypothetical protein
MDELFENWSDTKVALMEGLSAEKQAIVDPLLENQKNHLLNEQAAAGATQAHDIAGFRKILIPMIRRIIPGTIATELVGVQPMTGPVGLAYTLRYRYADAVAGTSHPNPFNLPGAIKSGDEVWGNASPIRQWYSSGATNAAGTSPADYAADQKPGAGGIGGVDDKGGKPVGIDSAEASGVAWPSSLPAGDTSKYGPYAESALHGHLGHAGTLLGGSGSFLEGSGGRRMTLDVVSQAVEAGSRKLQAGWTIEAMQDLNAQHGLDLESEMTQALSAEIVQEIDQEIITDLLALAGTTDTFDGSGAGSYGGSAGAGNYAPAFVGDRLANLALIINRVANEIARKTRRGAGNFIVVSPLIVTVLQSAAKSVFAPAVQGSFVGPNNTMLVGTLNGTIKVYSYLFNQAGDGVDLGTAPSPVVNDSILCGYKGGNGETDSGYFYCPYIPLMSSGVVVNPITFQPVVSLMTRYGKAVFTSTNTSLGNSADYYAKISVTKLDFT